MKVIESEIPDVLIIEPNVFGDDRGFFFESYNKKQLSDIGISAEFVQDNHSRSEKNVLRGLHYQVQHPQEKLIRVVVGQVFDVAVDLRRKSPTFGRWVGAMLSAENKHQMWIPAGFAHGFYVTSEVAEVIYKCTDFYASQHERTIAWNDPDLAIAWPLNGVPTLSEKDRDGAPFRNAELFQ